MHLLSFVLMLLSIQVHYGLARVAPYTSVAVSSAPKPTSCDTAVTVHAPSATPMFWDWNVFPYDLSVRTCRYECPYKARNCSDPIAFGEINMNPTPFSILEPLGAAATTTVEVPNPTHYSVLTVDGKPQPSTYEVTTTLVLPEQTNKDGKYFNDVVTYSTPFIYYTEVVLESGTPVKKNGQIGCERSRVTKKLPVNYLEPYTGVPEKEWIGVKTIQGQVPQGVLDQLGGPKGPRFVPGTYQGTPTIIAVVQVEPTDMPGPCEISKQSNGTTDMPTPKVATVESTVYGGDDGGLMTDFRPPYTLGIAKPEQSVKPPSPTDLPDPGDGFTDPEPDPEVISESLKTQGIAVAESSVPGIIDGGGLPSIIMPLPQITSNKMAAVITPPPKPNLGSVILSILSNNPPTPGAGPANTLVPVSTPGQPASPTPVITFQGSTITANSQSAFVIGGQTLNPGAVITVSNTPISLAPSPTAIFIGGSSFAVNNAPEPTAAPSITVGGTIFTASDSQFVIEGQTLAPGGVITVSGTAVSLGDSGSTVVIGSSTFAVAGTMVPVITVGGTAYTASDSTFVIEGQTLSGGGTATIGGTVYSLVPGGTAVVVGGTSTIPLSSVAVPTSTSSSSPGGTQNSGARRRRGIGLLGSIVVAGLGVIL